MSVVAVTGAGGTLGPAVVERLRAAGHELDAPSHAEVDLLDPAAAAAWAARLGEVSALVHLVGGWRGGTPIDEEPEGDWAWLCERLVGTVRVATRAFLPALRSSGGRFVLVSSRLAQAPNAENASYAAAKAAAEAWTLALARDLGEHGGTANVVVVGAIGDERPSFTPAADVAEAIAFLLSEHGAHANGQRIALHG
ncbi:MAG TPA: SDR family oxidoreductase [Solirubrobacteraceae bacterium]|nr:SDR family oxidoreductase [Solirubrobacteraceae bacterium]